LVGNLQQSTKQTVHRLQDLVPERVFKESLEHDQQKGQKC